MTMLSANYALALLLAHAARVLTNRQYEVLEWYLKGFSPKEIAVHVSRELGVKTSRQTVYMERKIVLEHCQEMIDEYRESFHRENGYTRMAIVVDNGGEVYDMADITVIQAEKNLRESARQAIFENNGEISA